MTASSKSFAGKRLNLFLTISATQHTHERAHTHTHTNIHPSILRVISCRAELKTDARMETCRRSNLPPCCSRPRRELQLSGWVRPMHQCRRPSLSLSWCIDSHTYKAASCRLRPITPVNWAAQSSKEKWKVIKGNGAFQVGSSCRKPPCFFPWKKSAVEAKEKFCLCCVYSHGQQEECAKPVPQPRGPLTSVLCYTRSKV